MTLLFLRDHLRLAALDCLANQHNETDVLLQQLLHVEPARRHKPFAKFAKNLYSQQIDPDASTLNHTEFKIRLNKQGFIVFILSRRLSPEPSAFRQGAHR